MRLRTLFFATPLLLAGITAHAQTTPRFDAPHDSRTTLPSLFRAAPTVTTLPTAHYVYKAKIARNEPCYAMRSYDYALDGDGSGRVTAQGSSTCQPASRYHLRAASGQ